ncbi:MAG: hypothetical protein RLZZ56_822, partial [Actinomycetota bacterium]
MKSSKGRALAVAASAAIAALVFAGCAPAAT